jgi:hypothetical protein
MKHSIRVLLGAGALALALTPAAEAAKFVKTVTVRVEGTSKTLLAPTTVKVPTSGWITKGGTPKGSCSATTAAGALNVATRHHWNGTWDKSFGALLLTSIFGQKYTLKSKDYWSIWVDGSYAQSGLCDLKLHRGEQLLFAAVPDSFPITGHVLVLKTSASRVHVGSVLTVTAGYRSKHGFTRASGVTVSGGGVKQRTDAHGQASFTITHAGTLVLRADGKNYLRSAPVKITELP